MLKKSIFLILCTNMIIAVPSNVSKNFIDRDFTQRQRAALRVIRVLGALTCGAGMASGFTSLLPKDAHFLIKATVFAPVSLLVAAVEYGSWETYDMDGYYKRHKWLLLGL